MTDDDLVSQIESGAASRDVDKSIRVYTCSLCGKRGHTKRTCGRKPKR